MSTLLTSAEVAELLRIHPKHVYRLLHRGLPAKRVGGKWLFERAAVLAWAEVRGQGGPSSDPSVGATGALPPPLIAANGDLAVELLLRHAGEVGGATMGFVQADRGTGLSLLQRRSVLATGVHGHEAIGHGEQERFAWLHLVDREIGLVRRRGRIAALPEMSKLRWASRPSTAGVRDYLDAALRRAGIDPALLHERALLLPSHRQVVCAVARGDADIGLASSAWAAELGLTFKPLLAEPYGLMVRAADLGRSEIVRLCETAQSRGFRRALAEVSGYEARHTGSLRFLAAA